MFKANFDDGYSAFASPQGPSQARDTASLLARGQDLLRLGDLGGADAAFSQLLTLQPNNREARVCRADARYGLGRFADAEHDFVAVTGPLAASAHADGFDAAPSAQDPILVQAHTGLAHVLSRSMAQDSLSRAQAHLDAARRANGGMLQAPWGQLAQARVAFESGDVAQAQSQATTLVQQHRNDPRTWLTLAEFCDARGQFVEAAEAAERACGVCVDDAADVMTDILHVLRQLSPGVESRLQANLRHLQARSGRLGFCIVLKKLAASGLTEAQQDLLYKVANALPQPERLVLQRGADDAMAPADATDAEVNQSPALQRMRTADPAALSACAISALRSRGPQWQQTFGASMDLLLQRSGPLGFWTLITKAEEAVDTPGRVAKLLRAAAAINPQDRLTHMLLLRVQSRMGELDMHLLAELTERWQDRGGRVFALELEAESAKQRGDFEAAIRALDAVCQLVQEPRFFALRASLKLAQGYEASDVRHDCAQALSYDGLHYLALYTKAQQDIISRDLSTATKTLQLLRTKYPDQPDTLYALGEIATAQGMSTDAIECYKGYLEGTFALPRQYEDEARLSIGQALLNVRDYGGALKHLVQIDETHSELHKEAQTLRTLIVKRQGLQDRGVLWWASLPDIEALIDAKQYDKALATLHHHGAKNARNIYSLALRARVHLEMGNYAQAEADARMAQRIAYWDCVDEPLSARILREAQAKNGSVIRMLSEGVMAAVHYFQSY